MKQNKLSEIVRKSAIAFMQDSFWFANEKRSFLTTNQSRLNATKADYCFSILKNITYAEVHNLPTFTFKELHSCNLIHNRALVEFGLL